MFRRERMADADNSTWVNATQNNGTFPAGVGRGMQVELRIGLYVAIFVLSVSGNALVALTIAQNRRMRTLTNVLLLNLSIADLLLSVFCMPFTLVPTLLQDFIFGPVVCVLVRYMQGASRFSPYLARATAREALFLVAGICDFVSNIHNTQHNARIYYAATRRKGGSKRCFCPSVCPYVRPSRT